MSTLACRRPLSFWGSVVQLSFLAIVLRLDYKANLGPVSTYHDFLLEHLRFHDTLSLA